MMKRSKRAARRRWGLGKALGLMVLAGTLAFLFSGKLPAALPEEPADENGVFRQPVRVLHHPAEWAGESDAAAPEEKTDQTAPVETPRMPELPVEEPAEAEEDVSVVVPQSEPVGMEYFSDAVFLGDSRTEGLYLYGNMTEGEFLYAVGATVESVFTKPTQTTEAGKVPMLDALADMECGKVYIMLGVNELGSGRRRSATSTASSSTGSVRTIRTPRWSSSPSCRSAPPRTPRAPMSITAASRSSTMCSGSWRRRRTAPIWMWRRR